MNFDHYYDNPAGDWPDPLTAGEYRQMLRERGRMFELDGFCDAEGRAGVAMIGGSSCLPRNKRALRIRDRVFRRLTAGVRRSRRRDARLAASIDPIDWSPR